MNLLLAILMLSNFLIVGTSRIAKTISLAALQGFLLGVLMLTAHHHWSLHVTVVALAVIGLKGVLIPRMLNRALRNVAIQRELEPFVGFVGSLMMCALGTGLAMVVARVLAVGDDAPSTLIVPAAMATLFAGLLVLVTRREALTQVVGYLVMENGVFVFGLILMEEMPLLVETGVLLDLVVCIFVMGIVINHIRTAFDSLDTRKLTELRD